MHFKIFCSIKHIGEADRLERITEYRANVCKYRRYEAISAIFRSRKRSCPAASRSAGDGLQWSSDLSIAETSNAGTLTLPVATSFNGAAIFRSRKQHRASIGPLGLPGASMEPRSFDRGNFTATSKPVAAGGRLQWSRDLSIAETRCRWRRAAADPALQWSRDLSIAETGAV